MAWRLSRYGVGLLLYLVCKVSYDLQIKCGIVIPRFLCFYIHPHRNQADNYLFMKKLALLFVSLFTALTLSAQSSDVTKFLGIPVDGTKSEMIQKLKAKGFTSDKTYGTSMLEGKFNGSDVFINVVENSNKVYRIAVMFPATKDESDIRIFFNRLYQQFLNNGKYTHAVNIDQSISEEEHIMIEMNVNNKRYEADFYQLPEEGCENRSVWFMISAQQYGGYRILLFYENLLNAANGEDL